LKHKKAEPTSVSSAGRIKNRFYDEKYLTTEKDLIRKLMRKVF